MSPQSPRIGTHPTPNPMSQHTPDDGGVTDSSPQDSRTKTGMIIGTLRTVAAFILVTLPSLLLALLSFDASLIAGADAFIFSFAQLIFLGIYFAYRSWRT